MSETDDCFNGDHAWEWSVACVTTGPNLLGVIVTCWGQDGACSVCGTITWRRVEKEAKKL